MSEPSTLSVESIPEPENRRKHPRRKPDQLIYVDMGGNNGGFVLDVSESGLSFQGIMPLSGGGQTLQVKFKLPGTNIPIRAVGQLVHPGNSEMGGGLRLMNLTLEERLQLREWVTRRERAEEPASGPSVAKTNEVARAEISKAEEPGGFAENSVAAKPELPKPTPPIGAASTENQKRQSAPASERLPAANSELKVSATPRATNERLKTVRQPVLQSNAVKKQRPAKSSHMAQFAAGLAAGCLALMAIGGGLVATGRLNLTWSSSTPSSNDARAANLDPNSQQFPAQTPAADVRMAPAARQFQAPVTTVRFLASTSTQAAPSAVPSSLANMEPPTLVSHSDPVYPQDAKAANVQGSVDVLATIGADGVPRGLSATRGDTRLTAAAIAAISQWRYKPAMLNGQPAESQVMITVTFAP